MESLSTVLIDVLNPESIIRYGGLTLLLLVVFTETGLFFGFFLPGDSLLFIAGLLSDSEYINQPVWVLIILLLIAAVSGSSVGYWFGAWTGLRLKNKKENLFYKRKYLEMTENFYQKHGLLAFVFGRFLPIIRTFVPILSGVIRIPFGKFFFYNVVGAACWILTMVLAGHFLGNIFPNLIDHVEWVIIILLIATTIPLVITYRRNRIQ
jgi:membrane-associated protein